MTETDAALRVHKAALQAVIVKIEVARHADAFILFESLNNRGMSLSPVDLIKNHLLQVEKLGFDVTQEMRAAYEALDAGDEFGFNGLCR